MYTALFYVTSRIPKVTLLLFRVRCGTLNSNESKEYECLMEFPLIHFNLLLLGFSGYDLKFEKFEKFENSDNCPREVFAT